MGKRNETLRVVAVAFFAVAAVLAGIGNERNAHWLVAIAFACFGAGAISFLRWRAAIRGRVLASEMKTLAPDAAFAVAAPEPGGEPGTGSGSES